MAYAIEGARKSGESKPLIVSAKSLEEIAQLFDKYASQSSYMADPRLAKNKQARLIRETEAKTWRDAARMIRETPVVAA